MSLSFLLVLFSTHLLWIHINAICLREQVHCSDIITSSPMWSFSASGIDVGAYTGNLQWIGCPDQGYSCISSSFYCNSDSSGMEFGSTASGTVSTSMRALYGTGAYPTTSLSCCSAISPRGLCNAPDKVPDATQLCLQLGYETGTSTTAANTCPEIHWDGAQWTSDWVNADGYGYIFSCTNPCGSTGSPTKSPTDNPSNSPTKFPTNNPSKSPTDNPSKSPTGNPSKSPTDNPSKSPTDNPSKSPTNNPSVPPTNKPSTSPSRNPSVSPTESPTNNPSISPTESPTDNPSVAPSNNPSISPTTKSPTDNPTTRPSQAAGGVQEETTTYTIEDTVDGNTNGDDDDGNAQSNILEENFGKLWYFVVGIIALLLCILWTLLIIYCMKRKKNKKDANNHCDGPIVSMTDIGQEHEGNATTTGRASVLEKVQSTSSIDALYERETNFDDNNANNSNDVFGILPQMPIVNNMTMGMGMNMVSNLNVSLEMTCGQCLMKKPGKADKNGNFYCNVCWLSWEETEMVNGEDLTDSGDEDDGLYQNNVATPL